MITIQLNPSFLKAAGAIMAVKDIRYYLNGVLVDVRARETRIVATDGHKLVVFRTEVKGEEPDQVPAHIIIPGEVIKAMKPGNVDCLLTFEPVEDGQPECKLQTFSAGPDQVFKAIDGRFPDCDRVIPTTAPSMEYGHFNPLYVADFAKAAKIAFDSRFHPEVYPNGPKNSALVLFPGHPEFVGVLMPAIGTEFAMPEWITMTEPKEKTERPKLRAVA